MSQHIDSLSLTARGAAVQRRRGPRAGAGGGGPRKALFTLGRIGGRAAAPKTRCRQALDRAACFLSV